MWVKELLFIFLIIFWSARLCFAGSYMDLSPGVSTKVEVEKVLGKPVGEFQSGSGCNYAPEKHDARRLSVTYVPETQVVQELKIYFKKAYPKTQVQSWFKLGPVSETRRDEGGNRVEYYFTEGMALHFAGPAATDPVNALTHFDPTAVMVQLSEKIAEENPPVDPRGKIPTLGVTVSRRPGPGIWIINVLPGSAAQKAGLRQDDIILEAGTHKFYAQNSEPADFVQAVTTLPYDQPARFYVQRGSTKFEVKIILDLKTPEDLKQAVESEKQVAESLFEAGLRLRDQKQWNAAIRKIREAIFKNTQEPRYYRVIADIFYQIGEDGEAIKALNKLLELNPDDQTYMIVGKLHFGMGQFDQAVGAFRRAQRMRMNGGDIREANAWLGAAYFEMGNVDEAQGLLVDAYKKNKKDAFTVFYMASCFDRKNLTRDATVYYKVYLNLREGNPQREGRARSRLRELTNNPQYLQERNKAQQKMMTSIGQIMQQMGDDMNKTQNYSQPSTPGQTQDPLADIFKNSQQNTGQYDNLFKMPPK